MIAIWCYSDIVFSAIVFFIVVAVKPYKTNTLNDNNNNSERDTKVAKER